MKKTINVRLDNDVYAIDIGKNNLLQLKNIADELKLGNYGIVITSSKVYRLYKNKLVKLFGRTKNRFAIITVPNGEKAKTKEIFFKVLGKMLEEDKLARQIYIIAIGGGTVGDLAGFVAAVYRRGISVVQVPTTLLAQVDSSIGGKTAIDLGSVKNIVGAYWQPKKVVTDISFLETLSPKEFRQGIAEAIKYGIILDKSFFKFLNTSKALIMSKNEGALTRLVLTCAEWKAKIVSRDEKEQSGLRTILNFGHTFAHALEGVSGCVGSLTHGEAVAIGMVYAAYLSLIMGKSGEKDLEAIIALIKAYKLPVIAKYEPSQLYNRFVYDKKFLAGQVRMVLLNSIGKVEVVNNVPLRLVRQTLKNFPGYIDKYR